MGTPEQAEQPWGARTRETLELPGHLPAQLWVPEGRGESALRLVVVAHGAGGRGSDHCAFWDTRLAEDVVLFCPAGKPLRASAPMGGAFFPDHYALRSELGEALAALEGGAIGGRIRAQRVFIGYSQGATMGALAIVGEISFSRLVLIEGGGENWTASRGAAFAKRGGEAVFFSCGTRSCAEHAARSVEALRSLDLDVGSAHAEGAGHSYWGAVGEAALEQLGEWGYQRER